MTDFGWHLPPGVTDAMIDARYEDAEEEARREAVEAALQKHPGWRRYVAAPERGRRDSLLDEMYEDEAVAAAVDGVYVGRGELADYAEELRRIIISGARRRAARNIYLARRAAA